MIKNLVIVESPAKAKTIEKFLGQDFTVKSSFGHIRDLSKTQLGVDILNNFLPTYEIPKDKTKIVNELKKLAKESEMVWLATDEDREGEAISWHLFEALNLKKNKTHRIVFHEITKTAIVEAIENPRQIDMHIVDAQQARRVLDRLVGYELSPVLWRKVKPSLSAGRVQSVAVRLIVEREEEIKAFQSTSAFKIQAIFLINESDKTTSFTAELPQRLKTKKEALELLEKCKNAIFTVFDIEKTPFSKSPAPPFTTSTLQQEASRKLGFPVARTMQVAQQLYEAGYITYMRTDSVNLSNSALAMAKEEITAQFGKEYVKTRKYQTKSKGAQEAHEAIRPTYFNNQNIEGDGQLRKLYDLIWKRTIASQMSDAKLERTTITIDISTTEEKFVSKGEKIMFDGFLKVYIESKDEEDDESTEYLPSISKGDVLTLQEILAIQRFSQSPPRYTEASLVKKLEELGIGRPSTYAPTISTIQKREYVLKETRTGTSRSFDQIVLKNNIIKEETRTEVFGTETNKLFPTDIGTVVTKFLIENFIKILDYNFTAKVEKEFDDVAQGLIQWEKMIAEFYTPFHLTVENTIEHSEKASGERLIGKEPKTGINVYAKIGRFGPIIQIGEKTDVEKPRFAAMQKNQSIETITLEEAMELFRLPRLVGKFEEREMTVAIGKFGPYVKHDGKFFSLSKTDDPYEITTERAIEIIELKREADENPTKDVIKEWPENLAIRILNGRFGPYLQFWDDNYKIPKGMIASELTLKEALDITRDPENKSKKKKFTRKTK
ncbi:MAG: type I DNA topoisomerase [Bacteroidota bacterium]